PLLVERRGQLRWILQVPVEKDDGVAGRDAHAAGEGALRTEIPRMGDDRDVLRARSQLGEYLGGVVGAGVVDEDDLVVDAELGEDVHQPVVHDGHRRRIAVAGDHRAQARTAQAWTRSWSAVSTSAPREMPWRFCR